MLKSNDDIFEFDAEGLQNRTIFKNVSKIA